MQKNSTMEECIIKNNADLAVTDSSSFNFKENFDRKLIEYDEQHQGSHRKPWTSERIIDVIKDIKKAQVTMSSGQRRTAMDYYWMSKYDIMTIANEDCLIFKTLTGTAPAIRILPREQYYDVLSDIHKSCGHGGRDKILYNIKNKYYIPKKAVEIFLSLCPICETERNTPRKGKFVIKKWSQTRDAWIRTLKEDKKCKKSGMPSKPYRYHDQMMFLRKVVLTSDIESSPSKTMATRNERVPSNEQNKCEPERETRYEILKQLNMEPATSERKRKVTSEMDEKMTSFIDYHNAMKARTYTPVEERNLTFFKSLLPSLALLDDDQTLEFQSGVLSLLQTIKRRPAYYDCGRQPQGFYSQQNEDLPRSPSATSLSAQSQSSEVPEQPLQVKIELE